MPSDAAAALWQEELDRAPPASGINKKTETALGRLRFCQDRFLKDHSSVSSACRKSAMMSSGSSRPTLIRTSPSGMLAAASSSLV